MQENQTNSLLFKEFIQINKKIFLDKIRILFKKINVHENYVFPFHIFTLL